jgi:hypothetical protein
MQSGATPRQRLSSLLSQPFFAILCAASFANRRTARTVDLAKLRRRDFISITSGPLSDRSCPSLLSFAATTVLSVSRITRSWCSSLSSKIPCLHASSSAPSASATWGKKTTSSSDEASVVVAYHRATATPVLRMLESAVDINLYPAHRRREPVFRHLGFCHRSAMDTDTSPTYR